MREVKQYFCGIIEKDKKLLLIKRGNKLGYGFWAFPGGKAKGDESSQEAVEREVLEETGLRCKAEKKIFEFFHSPKEQVLWFVCKLAGGELKASSDVLEAKWIDKNEIFDLDFREGHDQAARVYLDL